MRKAAAALALLIITGCGSVQVNSEARFRVTVGEILKECPKLKGKEVVVTGTYKGWDCPPDCKNPGITRSDSCISDGTGCIYLRGTGGFDPLLDRGKKVEVTAVVKEKKGTCYLVVKR
ncbi:hypothetical protein [Thermovibrio ammonificans]|jgi:hypothetical protein|uniref:Lipoprotein n=1 Tax=Thermovibrio ammonificans (strain DSM 15698 / JCM 12110 / HB-1) TaxID=648996 RepID=E8T259_THEA1|nr:hypothetical protein [Thermovibrio ammonificans]ADU96954.1 hypothetical protein Theam_0987 [Thermovibrio ammonificans HB-1]